MRRCAIFVLVVFMSVALLTSACSTHRMLSNAPEATSADEPAGMQAGISVITSSAGDYLEQTPPGSTPRVFAPGIVSTDHHEHSSPTFSPDGKEVYWSLWRRPDEGQPQVIMFVKQERGRWTPPRVAPFSGRYKDGGPVFSHDGEKLYFYSRRPIESGKGEESEANHIWYVERTARGWGEPKIIGVAGGAALEGVSPSVAGDGSLYFSGKSAEVRHPTGIYRIGLIDDRYAEPEALGQAINSPHLDWTPFIGREARYLIFSSDRPGQRGDGDLYISFRRDDGTWGSPVNMGDEVNTAQQERFPSVSPDGRYLFFTRSTNHDHDDVFWVDAGIIEELRSKVD